MKRINKIWLTGLLLFLAAFQVQALNLEKKLSKLAPGVKVKRISAMGHFKESFRIELQQPLDHANPDAGSFTQYLYLSHVDLKKPMLLETEGYRAYNYPREISQLFQGNQLIVEYRYYGKSKPDPLEWKYLTNDQAIEDLHRITTLFKKLYKGKWISSGISKGGETTLIYRSKYPDDVQVSVPYVAPIILAREDPRTDAHIANMGSEACQAKLYAFQRHALTEREALINILKDHALENKEEYTLGYGVAVEYCILEFTFSFWQWGGNCEDVPGEEADAQEIFNYLNRVVSFNFYSDKVVKDLEPSFYQHLRELGYYGFPKSHLEDLLVDVKDPTNATFAPAGVDLTYNPGYMAKVSNYLVNQGNNILYIYGELDTWSACAVNPGPSTNALKMVLKGGSHSTRIKSFSEEEKQTIYDKLEEWLQEEVTPLEK